MSNRTNEVYTIVKHWKQVAGNQVSSWHPMVVPILAKKKHIKGVRSLEPYFVYTFTIDAEEPYVVRVNHTLCLLYVIQKEFIKRLSLL